VRSLAATDEVPMRFSYTMYSVLFSGNSTADPGLAFSGGNRRVGTTARGGVRFKHVIQSHDQSISIPTDGLKIRTCELCHAL
jgi:hypothetical protein